MIQEKKLNISNAHFWLLHSQLLFENGAAFTQYILKKDCQLDQGQLTLLSSWGLELRHLS